MVKQNRQKKQTKRRAPGPKKNQGQKAMSVPRNLVEAVCSITDPFCHHAVGSKYPDDSSAKTLAWTHTTAATITTTNGVKGTLIFPQFGFNPVTNASALSGSVVTNWTAFAANNATLDVDKYRITSYGVRLNSTTSALTAAGMVHIRTLSLEDGAFLAGIDTRNYQLSPYLDIPLSELKDVKLIGPHTSAPAQQFYLASDDTGTATGIRAPGFSGFTIYLSGVPDPTSVFVEVIVHYELLLEATSNYGQLATPPPAGGGQVAAAAAAVTSSIPSIIKSSASRLGSAVVSLATDALIARYAPLSFASNLAMKAITVD